jgi:hypothetical protein
VQFGDDEWLKVLRLPHAHVRRNHLVPNVTQATFFAAGAAFDKPLVRTHVAAWYKICLRIGLSGAGAVRPVVPGSEAAFISQELRSAGCAKGTGCATHTPRVWVAQPTSAGHDGEKLLTA